MTKNRCRNHGGNYLRAMLLLHLLAFRTAFADAKPMDYTEENSVIISRLREIVRREAITEEDAKALKVLTFEELLQKKLTDKKMIEALLESSKKSEPAELLPEPSPIIYNPNPDKRQTYLTLCHFKICNMGRPRLR